MLIYLGRVCFHAQFHTSVRVPVFFVFLLFLPPACVSEHACVGVSLAV